MSRKDIAINFLKLAAAGKARESQNKFLHPDFKHHNPYFPGDLESLMKGMEENAAQFPGKVYKVFQAIEENDRVAVHGSVRLTNSHPEIALIHVFRFEGDLIIETWEAAQETPKNMPNENGMF